MNIGDKIKVKRKEKKISQRTLANILEIPFSTLANYENGHRQPNIETLTKIASALNISTAQLLDVEELLDKDTTTKAISSLFNSFILDIIVEGDKTTYEVKFPELEPFRVNADELHQLEKEVISQIQYWAWKKANHQNTTTD